MTYILKNGRQILELSLADGNAVASQAIQLIVVADHHHRVLHTATINSKLSEFICFGNFHTL